MKEKKEKKQKIKEFLNEIKVFHNNQKYTDLKDKDFLQSLLKDKKFQNYLQTNVNEYTKLQTCLENYKDYNTSDAFFNFMQKLKETYNNYSLLEQAVQRSMKQATETITQKLNDLDKNIKSNLEKSKEMLGEHAETSNAQKYNNYAERNRKSARGLFWTSIIIMMIVAGGATFLFWNIKAIDGIKLLARIPLGFLILLPAFFMMREAKKLKDKEFQYKDMVCRITTSEPYIDSLNLPSTEKAKLKANLVKEFFGRPIECRDDGGLPPIENICEIIKTCLESCKKN